MSKRAILTLAIAVGASAAGASLAAQQCPEGRPVYGSFGVGEFECVNGSCAINARTGDSYAHSFSTEPKLRDIEDWAEILRDGDVLIAIDDRLITTAEGGRRLGSLRPGQDVKLRLRRDGREINAWLRTRASCELPRLTVTSGSRTTWAPMPDHVASYLRADSVPRDSVRADTAAFNWAEPGDLAWPSPMFAADSTGFSFTLPRGLTGTDGLYSGFVTGNGAWLETAPPVEFGVELTCGTCGWRVRGRGRWFETDVFPVVASIVKGGPADTAGLAVGDRLLAVGGHPITSSEAGRLLASLEPGDTVRLEVRRGDRVLEISLSPRAPGERRQRW